jgi:4-hydroxybenzoate polyprenyltransferase
VKVLFLIVQTMRPKQWTKNLVLFAALVFSQNLFNLQMLGTVILGFAIFCLLSGSVYILNDLVDLKQDQNHPSKSKRPLASGRLKSPTAAVGGGVLVATSLLMAFAVNVPFGVISVIYLVLQIGYSTFFKHIVIVDVFCVAAGFVLRAAAGAEVIAVPISSWLLICTILLALFLALSKRRHELLLLDEDAVHHRKILFEYSPGLLEQMNSVVTSSTVVAYALYTLSPETVRKFGHDDLKYTVPFVLYGIFRYLYLIHQRNEGGSPEKVLLTDIPLIINILLYGLTVGIILYL